MSGQLFRRAASFGAVLLAVQRVVEAKDTIETMKWTNEIFHPFSDSENFRIFCKILQILWDIDDNQHFLRYSVKFRQIVMKI